MTSRQPRRIDPQVRPEILVNWLALLALLALGVVWPGDELPGAAAPGADSAAQRAPPAAQTRRLAHGTPNLQLQAAAGHELP